MKAIFKLAVKSIFHHKRRTVFTLLCVILSVSLLAIALFISDTILANVDFAKNPDDYAATKSLCTVFSVMAIFMSCFTVCTVFSVSTQDRIKEFGFLTSIGMSVPQKALMIVLEALLYGILGVFFGTALGFVLTSAFYKVISSLVFQSAGVALGTVAVSLPTVFAALLLGLCAVLFASFLPILKMRKISVLATIKTNNEINISLRESILSKLTGKLFGRLGVLAGQNYDNNKRRYRAISLSLSGGTVFFLTVHSFFLYPFWYSLDNGHGLEGVESIWYPLAYISALFMAYFVFVFIFCSMGSVRQNIEQRKSEFAMYKSMGMQNSELQKMVSIECLFFTWYAIWFGLLGSFIGTYIVCTVFRVFGDSLMKFHYATGEFLLFACLDIVVGFIFSLYFRYKIRKIPIIDTIRNG